MKMVALLHPPRGFQKFALGADIDVTLVIEMEISSSELVELLTNDE